MASSNRHWPSMFKSKPCNNSTHHQWQHDVINPTACTRTPYTPGSGCEERTPEPKPRWNPRPEQIRILEAIFNSGMVNPPRDEIRKIRAQLQEYGQVGDANVFYWFQNRKSRSKHKQRQLSNVVNVKSHQTAVPPPPTASTNFVTAPSSSSSSSDKSSPNNSSEKSLSVCPAAVIDLLNSNSPTASVNQPFFQGSGDYLAEPFFFPVQQQSGGGGSGSAAAAAAVMTQGFCFPDVADQSAVGNVPSFLLSELMLMGHCASAKKDEDDKIKLEQHLSYAAPSAPKTIAPPASFSVPSPYTHLLQGAGGSEQGGPTKSTVFINDVCFEVGFGPFSVREAFGDDVVLIQSSGQPVLTDEWGVTLQPLQHGGFYYLSRPFTASPDDRTIDLI